jgi:vancomycin resistance protein VanW
MKVAVIVACGLFASGFAFFAKDNKSEHMIGSYSTSLVGRTAAQRQNAQLALNRLRGVVIKPGELFSFNKRVGTWSRDEGYKRAPVSYNGTLVASWGGGVCQTSTTLYNAALLSGMDVVERSPHRFSPDYVPPGRDAAVGFPDIDLTFRNPLPGAVRIGGEISGDQLKVMLYSDISPTQKPSIVSDIRQVASPREFRLRGDGGTNFIRNTGKAGCDVRTYRIVGSERELISTDHYPVMNKIIEGD